MDDRYRTAAPIYDLATAVWSGGAIWRSRAAALDAVSSGATVLIPGPGTGRLAAAAAARGAEVTAVEPSGSMRQRLERRLARLPNEVRARVRVLPHDLGGLRSGERYDVVVAEHFLNVFPADTMPTVREALIDHVRPGGTFVVADFSPLGGPRPARWLQSLHHVVPLAGCALLTRNARHAIYDHGADLGAHSGVRLERWTFARSFLLGPRWFCTWTFRRVPDRV